VSYPSRTITSGSQTAEGRPSARPQPAGFLGRYPIWGLCLLLLGGLAFGVLAYNVRTNGPLLAWDLPVAQALHAYARHDSIVGFDVMVFSGTLGRETALAISILLTLYFLWRRFWHELSMVVLGVFGGNGWFELLSHLFNRHRPVFTDPLVTPLPGPGFPSGHSMTAVLLYGLILYLLLPRLKSGRWRLLAAFDAVMIILLIGFSRLYMGDHYLTDVLAGFSFGLAWGAIVYTGLELYRQRRYRRLRQAKT